MHALTNSANIDKLYLQLRVRLRVYIYLFVFVLFLKCKKAIIHIYVHHALVPLLVAGTWVFCVLRVVREPWPMSLQRGTMETEKEPSSGEVAPAAQVDIGHVKTMVERLQTLCNARDMLTVKREAAREKAKKGKEKLQQVMASVNEPSISHHGNVVKMVPKYNHRKITKDTLKRGVTAVLGSEKADIIMRRAEAIAREQMPQPEIASTVRSTKVGALRAPKGAKGPKAQS